MPLRSLKREREGRERERDQPVIEERVKGRDSPTTARRRSHRRIRRRDALAGQQGRWRGTGGTQGDPRQWRRRGLYDFPRETVVVGLGQISTVEDLEITAQMKDLDLVVAISEDLIG